MHEHNLLSIGEDRYLTTLLLNHYPEKNLKYIPGLKCETIVPDDLKTLVCQRRRWTNSLIHCHIELIMNMIKHKKIKWGLSLAILVEYFIVVFLPLIFLISICLIIINFTIQGVSLFQLILTTFVFCIPIFTALLSGRLEMILIYPIYFLSQFVFTVYIPIYSLFESDNFKWGETRKVQ